MRPPFPRSNRLQRAWTLLWAFLVVAAATSARGESVLSPDGLLAAARAFDHGDSIQAAALLAGWEAERPADPRPELLRLQWAWWGVLDGRDVDGGIERGLRAGFEVLAARCESALVRDPEDWIAAYTLGEAHCVVGRLDGLGGSAWGALRHHQKGIALLERVRTAFPDAPEPRASTGVFRYYASRMPRSVRALARLVRVRGDRRGGLADLRAAAPAPGLQQVPAQFFLVHILNDSEDDNLEALDWVLRLRAAAPRRVAVVLEHADVLADLDRPDLAVRTLEHAAAGGDSVAALQCRFLAGRIECETGRFEAAARRFDRLPARAATQVTWLAPWLAVYRGQIAAVRGDARLAAQFWNAARALPDAAGSRGAGEGAAERFAGAEELLRMAVEEALAWDAPPETLRTRVAALESGARSHTPRLEYTRGSAWLRLGEFERAAHALGRVETGGEDAWLVARTATRRLVALRAGGDIAGAVELAQRVANRDGEWGVPGALRSLAQATLVPAPPVAAAVHVAPAGCAVIFRFKDMGFAAVDLEWLQEGRPVRVPLEFQEGWWAAPFAVPPVGLDYVFVVNGTERVPDPAAPVSVVDPEDRVWSRHTP